MALGPVIIDIQGLALDQEDRDLLSHPQVGGVILFARNYADRAQLTALTQSIHELKTPSLLIAVDHEGGRVQRFRSGFTPLPPAAILGQRYDEIGDAALQDARDCGLLLAAELRTAGVDLSFAPVLDLAGPSSVIGDRALHRDPQSVARIGQAFMRGMHEGGMAAVAKHFPGHGTVVADSHVELPVDERDYDDINARDLVPFRLLVRAGVEGVMPAHVLFPKVDAVPAGFSSHWLRSVLRDSLDFRGVIFSDDVAMAGAAAAGTHLERARAARTAGCDMVLVCNDRPAATDVVTGLEAPLDPIAQVRLMRVHGRRPPCTASELTEDAAWRTLAERVTALNDAFELGLDSDHVE